MIPNEEKEDWHYLAVKNLSALLRGITSKINRDFYCLNWFPSFRINNKLKSQEKVCKKKGFCGTVQPAQKINQNLINT